MVVVAHLSVDLVESVDLVSVVLVVNCTSKGSFITEALCLGPLQCLTVSINPHSKTGTANIL